MLVYIADHDHTLEESHEISKYGYKSFTTIDTVPIAKDYGYVIMFAYERNTFVITLSKHIIIMMYLERFFKTKGEFYYRGKWDKDIRVPHGTPGMITASYSVEEFTNPDLFNSIITQMYKQYKPIYAVQELFWRKGMKREFQYETYYIAILFQDDGNVMVQIADDSIEVI